MDIGPIVEEVYGSARYLFLYVVMGAQVSSSAAWLDIFPWASGAILD